MQTQLLLEMAAAAMTDRKGYSTVEGALGYAEAFARAKGGAAFISRLTGDTLVYVGGNGPALPIALFAGGLAGKPFAPLNYRLSDTDLRRLLARTAPSIAIVDTEMLPRIEDVEGVTFISREAFEAACEDPDNQAMELPPVDQPIAVLLFTSGTTGDPKAAVLRHGNLTSYVISTVEFMSAEESEAALVSVPPYHIAGISAVLTATYAGRRIAYLHAFAPDAWVEIAHAERITHAMVVPTMLGRILDYMEKSGTMLPHLRALSYGGGRMPLAVIERAVAMLPQADFVNAYGLTETSSTIAVLGPADHREAIASQDPLVRRRLGSVGKPLPSLKLEIRGSSGELLAAGVSGEVYVRGEQVAGEYLHKKMLQADGWFATNDAGWLDDDGYLFIEGRLDDVIVRGGENISPGEVEDVLRGHPQVRDVAVFGLPDDQWGEKVAAAVVPGDISPSIEDLCEWVRAKLRSTKTPETWEFRRELPYNETGKLLRRVLKAELTPTPTQ